jgi:hypothetical protein
MIILQEIRSLKHIADQKSPIANLTIQTSQNVLNAKLTQLQWNSYSLITQEVFVWRLQSRDQQDALNLHWITTKSKVVWNAKIPWAFLLTDVLRKILSAQVGAQMEKSVIAQAAHLLMYLITSVNVWKTSWIFWQIVKLHTTQPPA